MDTVNISKWPLSIKIVYNISRISWGIFFGILFSHLFSGYNLQLGLTFLLISLMMGFAVQDTLKVGGTMTLGLFYKQGLSLLLSGLGIGILISNNLSIPSPQELLHTATHPYKAYAKLGLLFLTFIIFIVSDRKFHLFLAKKKRP